MYCPKCNESFEEGSRRFCPTDGARLVVEATGAANRSDRGVFSNLIPQMSGISDLGARLSEAPGVVVASREHEEGAGNSPEPEAEELLFFEFDEPEAADTKPELPDLAFKSDETPTILMGREKEPDSSPVKKIDPASVPPGGVDLENYSEPPDAFGDLEAQNPEKLIRKVLKRRYRIIEFLGGDDAGLAFVASDELAEGKKVLARVHFHGESNELLDSILAEERVSLSHFSHPNAARFIDSGELSNRNSFTISEYVDGLSIGDILSIHGRLDTNRALRVIRQASAALNEAHQEGILHRDVRPENLVIDPDAGEVEQAKLVNFGASSGEPNEYNLVYKSPEVIDGRINTAVSDVFSLAVVSYEMLTGRLPFDGESKSEVLRAHYTGPADVPDDLPPSLNEVFRRALSFKPADRYKKAREFADAVNTALEQKSGPPNVVDLQPLVPEVQLPVEAKPSLRIQIPKPEKAETPALVAGQSTPAARELSRKRLSKMWLIAAAGILLLIAALAVGWYLYSNKPVPVRQTITENANIQTSVPETADATNSALVTGPLPRSLSQPPNTEVFQNTRQGLKGDLAANFLGFSLFYPKDWKVIGPQPGTSSNARGKFLDISRSTGDGRLLEQMLISYYASGGTFDTDAAKFPQLVRETNETLKEILPGYQMVSEGETIVNGDRKAYEIKFQGGGTAASGEKLIVWGRRLFVPLARQGASNGFEITMLATSYAENIHGVDDVGVRGELGPVLYSFEPTQTN